MRWDGFQVNFSHFVGGLFPPGDPLWWMVGVARVGGGIVKCHFHIHASTLRQEKRRVVPVLPLPIEVPVLDIDKRDRPAARQLGRDFDRAAQQMTMRNDAQHFDILGHKNKARDSVLWFSWRNIYVHCAN